MTPAIWGSFWQNNSLLQKTMTMLQGPKHPVLPSLIQIRNLHPWFLVPSKCVVAFTLSISFKTDVAEMT